MVKPTVFTIFLIWSIRAFFYPIAQVSVPDIKSPRRAFGQFRSLMTEGWNERNKTIKGIINGNTNRRPFPIKESFLTHANDRFLNWFEVHSFRFITWPSRKEDDRGGCVVTWLGHRTESYWSDHQVHFFPVKPPCAVISLQREARYHFHQTKTVTL